MRDLVVLFIHLKDDFTQNPTAFQRRLVRHQLGLDSASDTWAVVFSCLAFRVFARQFWEDLPIGACVTTLPIVSTFDIAHPPAPSYGTFAGGLPCLGGLAG